LFFQNNDSKNKILGLLDPEKPIKMLTICCLICDLYQQWEDKKAFGKIIYSCIL